MGICWLSAGSDCRLHPGFSCRSCIGAIMPDKTNTGDVYLLHFDPPYKHACHYVGFAEPGNEVKRIREHRAGTGARLCAVAILAGVKLRWGKGWRNKNRTVERRIKKREFGSIFQMCPVCRRNSVQK